MLKIIFVFIFIFIGFSFNLWGIIISHPDNNGFDTEILYQINGKKGTIDKNNQNCTYVKITKLVDDLVKDSDGTFRLFVTNSLIERIRKTGKYRPHRPSANLHFLQSQSPFIKFKRDACEGFWLALPCQ